MATGKKYYWIKLRKDFMTGDVIDFLMGQDNGAEYVVLYQMLCMQCINTNGVLATNLGEVLIPYDVKKIQRDCKYFSIDTVICAMELFKKLGLIYEQEDGTMAITNFSEMVGYQTDWAKQKAKQREKKKTERIEQENNNLIDVDNVHTEVQNTTDNVHANIEKDVDNVHTEKEIEKEIEKDIYKERIDHPSPEPEQPKPKKPSKHKHGEYKHVLLLDDEYGKLCMEYGEEMTEKAVKFLDEYIEMKGYKAKSHYLCMKKWVFNAVKEREAKQNRQQNYQSQKQTKKPDYDSYMKHETPSDQIDSMEKQLLQQSTNRGY